MVKWVFSRPSSSARSFMRSTKAASEPHRCSASATAQSFAETTATHFIMSETDSCSPTSSQIWLPPMEAARSEPVTMSSSAIVPLSTASATSNRVMTFVTEAGGRLSVSPLA